MVVQSTPPTAPAGAALIPLRRRDGTVRAYAIVDADVADWVNQWRWSLNDGYVRRHRPSPEKSTRQAAVFLHREILGLPRTFDGREGDHIDRDRLNCRRGNLRVLIRAEGNPNAHNQPSYRGSSSKYRGVTWAADRSKWRAQVQTRGKTTYFGSFKSEEDAAEAARLGRLSLLAYAVD